MTSNTESFSVEKMFGDRLAQIPKDYIATTLITSKDKPLPIIVSSLVRLYDNLMATLTSDRLLSPLANHWLSSEALPARVGEFPQADVIYDPLNAPTAALSRQFDIHEYGRIRSETLHRCASTLVQALSTSAGPKYNKCMLRDNLIINGISIGPSLANQTPHGAKQALLDSHATLTSVTLDAYMHALRVPMDPALSLAAHLADLEHRRHELHILGRPLIPEHSYELTTDFERSLHPRYQRLREEFALRHPRDQDRLWPNAKTFYIDHAPAYEPTVNAPMELAQMSAAPPDAAAATTAAAAAPNTPRKQSSSVTITTDSHNVSIGEMRRALAREGFRIVPNDNRRQRQAYDSLKRTSSTRPPPNQRNNRPQGRGQQRQPRYQTRSYANAVPYHYNDSPAEHSEYDVPPDDFDYEDDGAYPDEA